LLQTDRGDYSNTRVDFCLALRPGLVSEGFLYDEAQVGDRFHCARGLQSWTRVVGSLAPGGGLQIWQHASLGGVWCFSGLGLEAWGDDAGWIVLMGDKGLSGWRCPRGPGSRCIGWARSCQSQSSSDRAGYGCLRQRPKGKTTNLITAEKFGDLEAHVEFCVPRGRTPASSSTPPTRFRSSIVWRQKDMDGADCGGIYPRSFGFPKYHHIDDGVAPSVNACRAPGECKRST